MRHPHSLILRSLSVSSLIAITVFTATWAGTCHANSGSDPGLTNTIENQVLVAISRGKPSEVEELFSGLHGKEHIAALKEMLHAPVAEGADSELSHFAEQVIRYTFKNQNPALLQVLRDPRLEIKPEELAAVQPSQRTLMGVAVEASISSTHPTGKGVADQDALILREKARQVSVAEAALEKAKTETVYGNRGPKVRQMEKELAQVKAAASDTSGVGVDVFASVVGALHLPSRKQDFDELLTSSTKDINQLADHMNLLVRQYQPGTMKTFDPAAGFAAKFQARQVQDTTFLDKVAQKFGAEEKIVPAVQAAIQRIDDHGYDPVVVDDKSLRVLPTSSGGANLAAAPLVTDKAPLGGYQKPEDLLPKLRIAEEVRGTSASIDQAIQYAKANPDNVKTNSFENLMAKESTAPRFYSEDLYRTMRNSYINKNRATIAGKSVFFDAVEDDTFGKVFSITEKDTGGLWDNITGKKLIERTQTFFNKDGGRALVIITDASGRTREEHPLGDNSGSMLLTKAEFMEKWGKSEGMVFQQEPNPKDMKNPLPVPGAPGVKSKQLSALQMQCISDAMKSFAEVMPEDSVPVVPAFMPAQPVARIRTLPANFSSYDGREFFHDLIAQLNPKEIRFRVMDTSEPATLQMYENAGLNNEGDLVIPIAMPADPKVACRFPPITRFEQVALHKGLIQAKPAELQMASAVNLYNTSESQKQVAELPTISPNTPILKAIRLTKAEEDAIDAQDAAAAAAALDQNQKK